MAKGGIACASGKEVAEQAEIIITMVPDTPHVEAALFGENGVSEGLSGGKIVVDMSSISPIGTKEFAKRINALGCDYLDAPVSGGEVGAKNATLSIMVGGPEEAFARVKPLFELLGKNITLVGGNGDGQTTKVANQIIVALTIEAVGEALVFASKAGADPAKVRQALMGGFASSKILEVHGERMVKRTFEPGFRIELHQKDLNLALQTAQVARCVAAQYRDRAGTVQCLRRTRRRGMGSLRAGPRTGDAWPITRSPEARERIRRHSSPRQATEGIATMNESARELLRRMFDAAMNAAQPAQLHPATPAGTAARAPDRDWRRQGFRGDGPGSRGPLGRPARRAGGDALRLRRAVRAHRDRRSGASGARCRRSEGSNAHSANGADL